MDEKCTPHAALQESLGGVLCGLLEYDRALRHLVLQSASGAVPVASGGIMPQDLSKAWILPCFEVGTL